MLEKYRFTIVLGAVGVLGGILYAELIGCETGCTLKSSPWIMAGYGALFGGLIGNFIDDRRNKGKQVDNPSDTE